MTQNANSPYRPTDEIDLADLIRALWDSKALIVLVTIVVTAIAAAYAFLSTPVYQTSVHTLPPTASNLASYNVASQLTGSAISGTVPDPAPGIAALTPQDAYAVFLRYLASNTIKQAFFEEHYLPAQEANESEGDQQRAWRRLGKELTIVLPARPNETQASVTLEGANPLTISQWANAFVDLAAEAAGEDLLSGLSGEVEIRKRSLEDQIATARKVAQDIRQSHITRLQSALTIAENIGLDTPADGAPLIAINTQGLNTESINNGSLLYLRGAKALKSELQQLQQRKNDDAYIAEMPGLLKKQGLINGINLNPDLLSVTTIDRAAIAPEDPIKPKKALILLLGSVLGGMLGVFIALIRRMMAPAHHPGRI